jgi:hypothetical protein
MFDGLREHGRIFRETLARRKQWDSLVVHKGRYTNQLPARLVLGTICGHVKGQLSCPTNLTIVLIHTHDHETIMERCLRYVGIDEFVVLRAEREGPWHGTKKIKALLEYLESGRCETDYLLFLDSDDAVLRDDPAKALAYLQESGCSMLISSTTFRDFSCMPEVKTFSENDAAMNGYPGRFLNSGVFVGTPAFIRDVYSEAAQYITDDELTRDEYRRLRKEKSLEERLPDFPRGIGSDQNLLRYVFPKFHPEMQIDYAQRLAWR